MSFIKDITTVLELEEAIRSARHANQMEKAKMEATLDDRKPVSDILAEREKRYGSFEGHAAISQGLKDVLHSALKWCLLSPAQKESLEMIAHKMARALNGDPNYDDNWIDIAGYSTLVTDIIHADKQTKESADPTA